MFCQEVRNGSQPLRRFCSLEVDNPLLYCSFLSLVQRPFRVMGIQAGALKGHAYFSFVSGKDSIGAILCYLLLAVDNSVGFFS